MYQRVKKTKSVVITGYLGSGKTTFFNRICNTNQETKQGGQSVTQDVFSKYSAYGSGFNVLDTPGFGVKSKKIEHACAVMCALSEGPVNQILVVVKTERTDLMIGNYLKPMINGLYKRFKNLITVVVTHWDLITLNQTPEYIKTTKDEILKAIETLNVHSVLFVEKNDSGKEICQKIDYILKDSAAQNLEIQESEFYANFDLLELTDQIESDLNDAKEMVTVQFRKTARAIKEFIGKFDDKNTIMPEVMHALSVAVKDYANEQIAQFEKKNYQLFSQLYDSYSNIDMAYVVDIELKKELMIEVNGIIELAQKKMKFHEQHCFNFIKMCPHCGVIWIKVAGCNGQTTCGNFPTSEDDMFKSVAPPKRFQFFFTDKTVNFTDSGEQKITPQSKVYSDPGLQKRKGCGKAIVWGEIPPLPAHLVRELLDPGMVDFFAKEVEKKELESKLKFDIRNQVNDVMRKTKIIAL